MHVLARDRPKLGDQSNVGCVAPVGDGDSTTPWLWLCGIEGVPPPIDEAFEPIKQNSSAETREGMRQSPSAGRPTTLASDCWPHTIFDCCSAWPGNASAPNWLPIGSLAVTCQLGQKAPVLAWFPGRFRRGAGSTPHSRAWSWPALLLLITVITVWRSYDFVSHPELRAEDGLKVFTFFYEHRDVSYLLHFKAGYVPLLPNLLGWLTVRLPARVMPYFMTVVPTLLAALTASVFAAPAYRRYVHRDSVRYAACLALAVAPVGPMMTTSNTDYSIWNALLLLMWLALLPMPQSKLFSVLFAVAVGVLIWTHPLSIVALPVTLIGALRERRPFQRVMQGLLGALLVAHVFYGTRPEHAAFAKGDDPLQRIAELITGLTRHLCHDVIAHTLFPWGPDAEWFDYSVTGLFVVGLLLCALLLRPRVASLVFCLWVAYAIVVPMALVVLSREERGLTATRYHYVSGALSSVAWSIILSQLFISLARLLPKLRRVAWLPPLAPLAYFTYIGVTTLRYARYDDANPSNAQLVREFFSKLAEAEREQGGYCNIRLRCNKRHGDWPFGVDTRKVCAKKE